jgi:hypothetical protein
MIALIDNVEVLKAQKDTWGIHADSETSITYDARVFYQNKVELIVLADGTQITPYAKVFFRGVVPITTTDRLRYLDDFNILQTFDIREIKVVKDFGGIALFTKVVI